MHCFRFNNTMRKQWNFYIMLSLIFLAAAASAQEIRFYEGNLKQAQEEASRTGKPLMVYLWADWCGYCLYSEKNVFTSDTAYEYFNENYICLKVKEKTPDFKKLRAIYRPEVLPAYLFFNAEGKFIRMSDGYKCAADLKKEGERAKSGRKKIPGF